MIFTVRLQRENDEGSQLSPTYQQWLLASDQLISHNCCVVVVEESRKVVDELLK